MTHPTSWSCFGKLWDSSQPECTGGFDLAYTGKDQTRLRKRCSAYEACKRAKEQGTMLRPPQLVQHTGLPMAPPSPPMVPQTVPSQAPQLTQLPVPQQPLRPAYPVQTPPMPPVLTPPAYNPIPTQGQAPPWVAQQGPQTVPVPYQQPGAQIPTYLAVPEPMDGTSWLARLLAELIRGAMKAIGHSLASFFDHNPIRAHRAPVQQTPTQPTPPTIPPTQTQ